MRHAALLLLVLSAVAAPARAATDTPLQVEGGGFAEQRARLEAELAGGERYREITPEQRVELGRSLDRMAALLERGDVAQLSQADRVELFNAQEQANTILTNAAADSRVVCVRSRQIGSRMSSTSCRTVAERRAARDLSQGIVRQYQVTEPHIPDENAPPSN